MTEQFRTLVADPPWRFGDSLPGDKRGATKHYKTMSLEEIKNYELPPLADDCRLFLWRVASMQQEALDVIEAWGFTLKAEMVWRKMTTYGKVHFGMGRQVRNAHEVCLIATRGKPERTSGRIRSIFDAPVGVHSQKPEIFYRNVENLSPGPYCELFARATRSGWTCSGNEIE